MPPPSAAPARVHRLAQRSRPAARRRSRTFFVSLEPCGRRRRGFEPRWEKPTWRVSRSRSGSPRGIPSAWLRGRRREDVRRAHSSGLGAEASASAGSTDYGPAGDRRVQTPAHLRTCVCGSNMQDSGIYPGRYNHIHCGASADTQIPCTKPVQGIRSRDSRAASRYLDTLYRCIRLYLVPQIPESSLHYVLLTDCTSRSQ